MKYYNKSWVKHTGGKDMVQLDHAKSLSDHMLVVAT